MPTPFLSPRAAVDALLFGRTSCFAIEAELLEVHGKWTHGRLRFWVNGVPLGDFDDTSDLATSARWGRVFLTASPRRTRADLDPVTSQEVFEVLYGRFVQPVGSAPRERPSGPWERDPFVLDDVGESALRDKVAVVVVRKGDGSDRVLVKHLDRDGVAETTAPSGLCDRVIDAYCAWAEGLRATPS